MLWHLKKRRCEMQKLLIGFVLLVVFLVGVFCLLKSWRLEPEPMGQPPAPAQAEDGQAVVFDMTYRGLSGAKDEPRYNAYWGFGQRAKETPFIKEVRKTGGEFSTVYNSHFKGAEWSAVEVKDNKVVALYFDLDADGTVSENEKIPPIQDAGSGSSSRTEFVTPDFMMTTQRGHEIPFRALLRVSFRGRSSRPNCMWSPSCVLEGTATFNGKPTRLILFGNGFTGDFDQFGSCSYALQDPEELSGRYISRHTLSSMVNYKGQFYKLKLSGNYEKDKKIRAELEEYTGAIGELAIQLKPDTNLKTKLSYVGIVGVNDETVRLRFTVPSDRTQMPVGVYKLCDGLINYGVDKTDEWRLDFDFEKEPEFAIEADGTCELELGEPKLLIRAVEENRRYESDVKEQTIYSKGTNVHISRIIQGKAGELYGRFSEKQDNSGRYTDLQPELRIVDMEGKQIAAAKIEYG
jgi:hypothetical protein